MKQPIKKTSNEPAKATTEAPEVTQAQAPEDTSNSDQANEGATPKPPADDAQGFKDKLPADDAQGFKDKLLADGVQGLSDAELETALKTLRAEVKRRESDRESLRPKVGSKVRILKGRPKYVGKVGTAIIVRKSRCFVSVPEIASPAYALISDLELMER